MIKTQLYLPKLWPLLISFLTNSRCLICFTHICVGFIDLEDSEPIQQEHHGNGQMLKAESAVETLINGINVSAQGSIRRKDSDPSVSIIEASEKPLKSKDASSHIQGGGSQSIVSESYEGSKIKVNREICNKCKEGGSLILCDNCPRSFHLKCLGLKKIDIPEEQPWYCKSCMDSLAKKKAQEEQKRRLAEEKAQLQLLRQQQKAELDRMKTEEFQRKREEKRLEKERQEEEKRLQREKQEEEKKKEREAFLAAMAESKRKKEEEQAEQKRIKEAQIAESRAKREAEQAEMKRIREEQAAEAKRKREEEQMEARRKREEEEAERKRKREELLAAQAEAKKAREAAQAEARSKAAESKKVQKIGSQQSQGSAEAKESATKSGVQKKAEEKSEAEKLKEARQRELKNQFKVFQKFFPELVEKNSIRYPIEDSFIKLMPLLHASENFPQKPTPKEILVDGHTFERLLYIWEFFNNFSEFFNLAPFKLEELQASLSLASDAKPLFTMPESIDENEEQDWEEQITNKTVVEQGFGLINSLHMTAVDSFFKEARATMEEYKKSDKDANDSYIADDQLLDAVMKYFEKGPCDAFYWPEFIRLIFKSKQFAFHLSDSMKKICDEKLANCVPETYSLMLSYEEKIEVLETIVDGLHDLSAFKDFLNQRMEEKSAFNKQKMDIYAEIKILEGQKQEFIKEHQAQNPQAIPVQQQLPSAGQQLVPPQVPEDPLQMQIDELKKKLETVSRQESKKIQQQITDLTNEKNRYARDLQRFDDQIEKRQAKIDRLNEQANKMSIKNQVLGKDSDRNEYWFFKEDAAKIFFKKYDSKVAPIIPITLPQKSGNSDDATMEQIDASSKPVDTNHGGFRWFYYDEDIQYEKLLESCNLKGIRERRLNESLRKLRDRLKLKKIKRSKVLPAVVAPANGQQQSLPALINKQMSSATNQTDQIEETKQVIVDEEDQQSESESELEKDDRHCLFETDDFTDCIINAVWYGKKMPSKRQAQTENRPVGTRGRPASNPQAVKELTKKSLEDQKPNFDHLKEIVLNIECLYSDSGLALNREWDFKDQREEVISQINKSSNIGHLAQLLLRLDQGFSNPHYLRYKNEQYQEEEEMSQDEEHSDESEEEEESSKEKPNESDQEMKDENVRIIKLKFFKYWPSKSLRSAWREYVFQEAVDNNILALGVSVRILERVNAEFLQRQIDNQIKKQKQLNAQANQSLAKSKLQKENAQKAANTMPTSSGRSQPNYKQYFESEDDQDESESASHEESSSHDKVVKRRGRPPKAQQLQVQETRNSGRRGPNRKESSEDQDSYDQEDIDQSEEEEEESEDVHQDRCHICKKAGSLLCCDGCPQVAHLACIGLKKPPEGDWHCIDCLEKQSKRRTTRGQTSMYQSKQQISTRSSRR